MRRRASSHQHHDLVDRLWEGLQAAVEQHGYRHRGLLCLPFAPGAESSSPESPRDPAEPDAAIAVAVGVPEGRRRPVERAETDRQFSRFAARDLNEGERLDSMPKKRTSDHREHNLVVVETHAGEETVREARDG